MNRQKGSILVIIILLLAGAGLVFVGYKYAFKQKIQETPLQTPTPNPTADWKTYTISGYSIKIPSTYNISQSQTAQQLQKQGYESFTGFCGERVVTICPIFISVYPNTTDLSLDAWLNKYGDDLGHNLFPVQKTTFNNLEAYLLPRGSSANWYLLAHNRFIYFIQVDEPESYNEKLILSTFKFTK